MGSGTELFPPVPLEKWAKLPVFTGDTIGTEHYDLQWMHPYLFKCGYTFWGIKFSAAPYAVIVQRIHLRKKDVVCCVIIITLLRSVIIIVGQSSLLAV